MDASGTGRLTAGEYMLMYGCCIAFVKALPLHSIGWAKVRRKGEEGGGRGHVLVYGCCIAFVKALPLHSIGWAKVRRKGEGQAGAGSAALRRSRAASHGRALGLVGRVEVCACAAGINGMGHARVTQQGSARIEVQGCETCA